MQPSVLVTFEYIPIIFASLLIPSDNFQFLWLEPKYVTWETTFLNLAVCATFLLGYYIANAVSGSLRQHPGSLRELYVPNISVLMRYFKIASFLNIAGYLLFYLIAIGRGFTPSLLLGAISGQKGLSYEVKLYYFNSIPGITTCTQFGVAAVLIGTLIGYLNGFRSVRTILIINIFLAALRSFVLSERLALIEVIVPSAVLAVFLQYPRLRSKGWKWLYAWGPATAPFVLYCFFTVAEYFRSWNSYYANKGGSIWEFSFARLLGYYATAVNNAAFSFYNCAPPPLPYYTWEWLWYFPIIGDVSGLREMGRELDHTWMQNLKGGANPEFNNEGGLYLPIADYGMVGGLIWWFLCGALGSYLYKRFRSGHISGLLLFPVFFLGLLEGPRVLYLTNGRAFPHIAYLLVVAFLFRNSYSIRRAT